VSIDSVVLALGPYSALACIISITVATALATAMICLSRARPIATTTPTLPTPTITKAHPRPMELLTAARSHPLRSLTTAQLCAALQRSYHTTNNPPGQTEWMRLLMREQLLDEIERRDPTGFNRWLATAPCPGDEPSRYLTHDR
jgi:hypothetical protein